MCIPKSAMLTNKLISMNAASSRRRGLRNWRQAGVRPELAVTRNVAIRLSRPRAASHPALANPAALASFYSLTRI